MINWIRIKFKCSEDVPQSFELVERDKIVDFGRFAALFCLQFYMQVKRELP